MSGCIVPTFEKLSALLANSRALARWRVVIRTERSARREYRQMYDDENKPADENAPRGMSDELVDGDTLDISDDPAKQEEEPIEPHDKP